MDDKRPAGARRTGIAGFLGWIAATAIGLLVLLAATNWFLNPLTFSADAKREVAQAFEAGRNFAIDDPNIDFRGLRREHLRIMRSKPDVVIFAGSRFEVASARTFPGQRFYNTFGHNDYFEDLLAVTELLEQTGKLPRTLVVSVRHLTFRPIAQRQTDEWRMWEPEYRRMAEKLGIEVPSRRDTFPLNHHLSLFSVEYLRNGLAHLRGGGTLPYGPTTRTSDAVRDILHPDGSLTFSAKHIGGFTAESARAESREQAARLAKRKATVPTAQDAQALDKLLRYLQARGVRPVIAVTPHHPAFWDAVANENYGRTLTQLEAAARGIAERAQVPFVGSFNPAAAGCTEANFRDYIHLDEACLKAIFDKIPPLPAPKSNA
jgi:hypothetical protein